MNETSCTLCGENHRASKCSGLYFPLQPGFSTENGSTSHDHDDGEDDDSLFVSSHMPSTEAFWRHHSLQASDIAGHLSAAATNAAATSAGPDTRR